MAKLDLIGSVGAAHSHRKFNLEELVGLFPLHLKLEDAAVVSCLISSFFFFMSPEVSQLSVSLYAFHRNVNTTFTFVLNLM